MNAKCVVPGARDVLLYVSVTPNVVPSIPGVILVRMILVLLLLKYGRTIDNSSK